MTERPEHEKCIQQTHAERERKFWCGRFNGGAEAAYVSIDHAAYATENGWNTVCPRCAANVILALKAGNE